MATTTSIGRAAEAAAAAYLTARGFHIVSKNWRTRWCEIDVVATKESVVYFVEVKYRSRATWGSGLDYITSKKYQQMTFAAEMWLAQNNWQGDVQLLAVEITAHNEVTNVIEL